METIRTKSCHRNSKVILAAVSHLWHCGPDQVLTSQHSLRMMNLLNLKCQPTVLHTRQENSCLTFWMSYFLSGKYHSMQDLDIQLSESSVLSSSLYKLSRKLSRIAILLPSKTTINYKRSPKQKWCGFRKHNKVSQKIDTLLHGRSSLASIVKVECGDVVVASNVLTYLSLRSTQLFFPDELMQVQVSNKHNHEDNSIRVIPC